MAKRVNVPIIFLLEWTWVEDARGCCTFLYYHILLTIFSFLLDVVKQKFPQNVNILGRRPGPKVLFEWYKRPAESKDLRWIDKWKNFEKKTKFISRKKRWFSKSFKKLIWRQIDSPECAATKWLPTMFWRVFGTKTIIIVCNSLNNVSLGPGLTLYEIFPDAL